ncbi:protein ROLLING AND ERECT LEAF 2-like [Phragmites australis]|uniref:protein ROLLING AND ERECT LEAF 2-like n=1 Tax=Phragmites australis TaxID=29695 RepID=UPI002D7919F3|nr:protein ROLLING AND ERECT LEAF 2-like [Phragmites australis]
MGCKGSKLDDQEAVALCRARADLLAAAVRHRYALADAHAALADSLESIAAPLHRVLRLADSPPLTLPSERKGGAAANRLPRSFDPPSTPHGHSSHFEFGSSSGSEPASPADLPPSRVPEQQLPPPHPYYAYGYGYAPAPQPAYAYPATAQAGSLQFYYARSCPPPASVAVSQRAPRPPERVYFGSFDAAGGYPQYHAFGAQQAAAPVAPQRAAVAPPSPPKASSWDFFNVFENYDSYEYDNYYYNPAAAAPYTPSRSSREVREEEGIPDLEEDEEDRVVVKEVDGECSAPGSCGARSRRSSVGGVSSIAELDETENIVVHKDVMGEVRRRPPSHRNVSVPAPEAPARRVVGNADVAGEIKAQLVCTAEAAKQLAPLLGVGRPSYQGRSSAYHSSSRMMSAISVSHLGCKDMDLLDVGLVGKVVDTRSLSSVLEKLYFWERKLYGEVKAEEKMRLLLAKNSKRLKFLDQRGAEAHKIDATRNLLRKLSTKIRIAVRVIAKVSRKINKVRDEELCPQVNALIQGFVQLWQDKLDSYHTQCQVISEAKHLSSDVSGGNGGDLMELELELIKWIVNFSSWVNAQRNFVKALNGWLALCLDYEPEEADNGAPSYSPGKIGAPLVFVICNKWSQAMDRISEKAVVNAMQALVSSLQHLWEQQHLEQSEQIIAIREREKWIKILERKTQEINKEADELNKKLALIPSRQRLHVPRTIQMYEAHCVEASNLHINLSLVLQALENFAANSLQAFQEILRCAEGARLPRDNE